MVVGEYGSEERKWEGKKHIEATQVFVQKRVCPPLQMAKKLKTNKIVLRLLNKTSETKSSQFR